MANAAMLLQLLTRTLLASALLWWELRNKSWRPSHPGRIGSTMILSLRGDLSPLPAEDRLLGGHLIESWEWENGRQKYV
jgi:hypothetical protein